MAWGRKKRIVTPTPKEQKRISARLKARYPQMYVPAGLGKRELKAYRRASPADQKELARFAGLKMKKIYRKK